MKISNDSLKLEDQLENLVSKWMMKDIHAESRKYIEPQIMVITPDWYFAIDLCRALEKIKFENKSFLIKSHKLFSKACKPKRQLEKLSKGIGSKSDKKLINLYFGTPNRLLKFIKNEGKFVSNSIKFSNKFHIENKCLLDLNKSLKYVIIHCKKNKKKFTIFDIKDTRSDLHKLMIALKPHFDTCKKSQVMLWP